MKLEVAVRSAFEALVANPLRSFLTMLGIMIGVASVMAMMAISEGAARRVDEQIQALGASTLTLRPGAQRRGGVSRGANSSLPFTDRDLAALAQEPYAQVVAARNSAGGATLVAGDQNWSTTVFGVTSGFFDAQNWAIVEGELITDRHVASGAAVAVIGQTIAENLFDGSNPLGQRIRVNSVPVQIIGVLDEKGQGWGGDQDDVVVVPLSTARNRVIGAHRTVPKHVERIELVVADGYEVDEAQLYLEERVRELRGIAPGEGDDFRVYSVANFIRARSETQQTMGVLLAFTAAVSLIVGGVGVMNIMLVSVTERTREIGLRMAIGARQGDILGQFLAEAVALCLVGGLIGSGIGWAAAQLAERWGDFPVSISPSIALVALGASAFVGLFFGFFPARRAAQLNPIEALRHE